MKIEIELPEKVAKNIDDVVAYVKSQNPDRKDVTIESILTQECIRTVAGIYNAYLLKSE